MKGTYGTSMGGARRPRRSTREDGTNPRAKGTNPRRKATNPTAETSEDQKRVIRQIRQARARLAVRHANGLEASPYLCAPCDDTGIVFDLDGVGSPCVAHVPWTSADAYVILHPDD